jgi:hypothetical protein
LIVVDIGCHPQGNEESIAKLCKAYKPTILYGFDPFPGLEPGIDWYDHRVPTRRRERWEQTIIVRSRLAAWTKDGFVSYQESGITSAVVPYVYSPSVVPCFDLVAWLKTLPLPEEELVLKIDAEGSEYPLLWAIYNTALDLLIKEALVEYHPEHAANGWFEERPPLRCPVDDWDANW